jgi:hypothetical protein
MQPFPKEHDLIRFFECEPVLLDRGLPWAYTRLTFLSDRGDDRIACEMEPASEIFDFRWSRNGEEIIRLDLNWATGLELDFTDGHERLRVCFRSPAIGPLEIQLRPTIHVQWSTPVEPP